MAGSGRYRANEALILALACGATVDQAARSAGLSPRTAYRRLKDPEFAKRIEEARSNLVERTVGMLSGAGMEAVKNLLHLQQDPTISAAVRLGASRTILDMGDRYRESAVLMHRITQLEAQLGGTDKKSGA